MKLFSVVVHTFNSSTVEAEADGSLWIRGQPGLRREFLTSLKNKVKTHKTEKTSLIIRVTVVFGIKNWKASYIGSGE